MKYLLLLLLSSCTVLQHRTACYDPVDICNITLRTHYVVNTRTNDTTDEINIFVKNQNVLKWFGRAGNKTYIGWLDTYNVAEGWYIYEFIRNNKKVWVSIDYFKKTISFIYPDFDHEIKYYP